MASEIEKELKEEEKELKTEKSERIEMQMEAPARSIRWDKIAKSTLLIVVVGGLFLYIGYKYGQESGDKSSETASTETAVTSDDSTTVASASATTDATADWKTYTNDTYGFSFKYPADWEIITSVKGEVGFNPIGEKYSVEESEMSVVRFVEGNGTAFSESNYSSGYETTSLAGRTAYRRVFMGEVGLTFNANNQAVSLVNSTTPAVTGSSNSAKADQYNQIFDQILSTFQFTK